MLKFEQHCFRKLNEQNIIMNTNFHKPIIIKSIMYNERLARPTGDLGTISVVQIVENLSLILSPFTYYYLNLDKNIKHSVDEDSVF